MKNSNLVWIATASALAIAVGACGSPSPKTHAPVDQTSVPVQMVSDCSANEIVGLVPGTEYKVNGATYSVAQNVYRLSIAGDSVDVRTISGACMKQAQKGGEGASIKVEGGNAILMVGEDFEIRIEAQAGSPYYGIPSYQPYHVLRPSPVFLPPTIILDTAEPTVTFRNRTLPPSYTQHRTIVRERRVQSNPTYSQPPSSVRTYSQPSKPAVTGTNPATTQSRPADTRNSVKSTGSGFGSSTYTAPSHRPSTPSYSAPSRSYSAPSRSYSAPRSTGSFGSSSRSSFGSSSRSGRR